MTMRVTELLASGESRLATVSGTPRLDVEILLAAAIGRDRAWLRAFGEVVPRAEAQAHYETLLARRASGEPVAYVLGQREFWSLPLRVTPATLIPRADTELLVECALRSLPDGGSLLDLGTGSGAVALAVCSARPAAVVAAVDRSDAALAVARHNGAVLGLNVAWHLSDWFSALSGQTFDVIVGNPPYIAENDPHLLEGDLVHEPRSALVSGQDGMDDLRCIIDTAPAYLKPGGRLWLEHGFDQGAQVREALVARGFMAVETCSDLAGHDRVTGGRLHG
jgi:release factor glutamine methyltransferase